MKAMPDQAKIDSALLQKFDTGIWLKVPHPTGGADSGHVLNPTPLLDLTEVLKGCAREEFGLELTASDLRVLGKQEAKGLGGSVKGRPAALIIREAIRSGQLRRGQTVFEATSGNFGIALGKIAELGLDVVVLVSRRLQEGVIDELRTGDAKIIDLDIDICPAPGLHADTNLLAAKAVASNVRSQLAGYGFDVGTFDAVRQEVEALLAGQDVINLAKLLARVYGGFCPEQYDNDLNLKVHQSVTAPEIEEQLREGGYSLRDFEVICNFGTGGTSSGISEYIQAAHGKKGVHVVFPLSNQEVAGIRTREKAYGLKFYRPEFYAGIHSVDFSQAKRLLRYFVISGYDIGESSALSLFAAMQLANFGSGTKFVVVLADGADKYRKSITAVNTAPRQLEVSLDEYSQDKGAYGAVVWTHTMFTPQEEGKRLIASSLGIDESRIRVAKTRDVSNLIAAQKVPDNLQPLLKDSGGRLLLVCMSGGTSLRAAQVLSEIGVEAQSLTGGISGLSQASRKPLNTVVQVARD
jgi:cysteine synthase